MHAILLLLFAQPQSTLPPRAALRPVQAIRHAPPARRPLPIRYAPPQARPAIPWGVLPRGFPAPPMRFAPMTRGAASGGNC